MGGEHSLFSTLGIKKCIFFTLDYQLTDVPCMVAVILTADWRETVLYITREDRGKDKTRVSGKCSLQTVAEHASNTQKHTSSPKGVGNLADPELVFKGI